MREVWIIDSARSPRGLGRADKGSLAKVHPQRLLSQILTALETRSQLEKNHIEHVIIGCNNSAGGQRGDIARMAALNIEMRSNIAEAFSELTQDPEILVIIITGGDKVFAAGADLKLLADKNSTAMAKLNLARYWQPVSECHKPVIAAVNGYCLGAGAELMQMCDIVVADTTARIGQPEAKVGIMPGAGGTQRLVRAVGKPIASLMLMCVETLTGEQAYQQGLISELTESGQAIERARHLAQKITHMPPKAMIAIKRSLALGADLPLQEALSIKQKEFL